MSERDLEGRYGEEDQLRPDGMIETTRRWLLSTKPTPDMDEKLARVKEIMGDDALIYNVRMDVTTWAAWKGWESFGDDRIIRARQPGHEIVVVDNHFHDERGLHTKP